MNSGPVVIDLDASATTPVSEGVLSAMLPFFREEYGNPSSLHPPGERAKAAVLGAREEVARLLSADPREILFTSGGTESNQTAVRSVLSARPDRRGIVVSPLEHSSILGLLPVLEKEGYAVALLRSGSDGRIDPEEVRKVVDGRTALVAVMWVNNETGAVQPVGEIARIAREAGALFHSDGVAAAGKLPVDLSGVPVDSFSLSSHKICGPKGVGALFLRRGGPFVPLMPGSQERKRRGGTENVPGIVGLGQAARESLEYLERGAETAGLLRDRLEESLFARFPFIRRNGPKERALRAPHIANLGFPGVSGEKLQIELARERIYVSTGSACSSGSVDPSHVLTAMGVGREEALSALRFSLGRTTSGEEIDRTVSVLFEILSRQGIGRSS